MKISVQEYEDNILSYCAVTALGRAVFTVIYSTSLSVHATHLTDEETEAQRS